jgi:Tol biopolymer transport system component
MTDPARRRRVEEVCDTALDRPTGERAAFVAAACGDDHALRQEVEALLAHARTAEGFLAAPMGAVAARVLGGATGASVGRQISSYRILAHLGTGGMGEVYRARDTKLGRDVAIKVLPAAFTSDTDRLARFEREARLLAALNHPNIATIHGLEEADGVRALVMELVEGPTLAEKLAHDSQRQARAGLPIAEALKIGGQIADALEAAHAKGVIHRDLKPANIKLGHDGSVKVLDFGLAKAFSPDGSGSDMSHLPSLAATDLQAGLIVGTPGYMSPEQARGQAIDKRTDIWAFGCVLYEMLTGRAAFPGETISDTMAATVDREPEWGALPALTPAGITRLLQRCLNKDPKRRLRDIGEARIELETPEPATVSPVPGAIPSRGAVLVLPRWAAWLAAAVIVSVGVAAVTRWPGRTSVTVPTVTRFDVPVPSGYEMAVWVAPSLAISSDGSKLVFETQGRLHLRAFDRPDAQPIPGTDGGFSPFFSPDGEWIGFVRGDTLMKVLAAGGTPMTIVKAFIANGASWGPDGRIVFSGALGNGGLWSVSADGGPLEQITRVSESAMETGHYWPDVLPDGAVLYTVIGPSGHAPDARLVVEDRTTGTRAIVAHGVTYGRYVAGHLFYADANGTLLVQPFDVPGRRTRGPAQAVLPGVRVGTWGGGASYAVSSTGTLAYVTGTEFAGSILAELDFSGRERRRFGMPGSFGYLALSPDGRTLAMMMRSVNNDDIYLMDTASGRFDRFSFDIAEDESPVWSPDGRQVAYSSASVGEQRRVFVKTVGSVEGEKLVYTGTRHLHLQSWSPDGRLLAFYEFGPRSTDIWMLDLNDAMRLVPIATTPASERGAVFSPDGRWLAYDSDETGRPEVYVASLTNLGAKQMVSRDGAAGPQWSATDQELFFWSGNWGSPGRIMMARRVAGAGTIAWENPVRLFDVPRINDFAVARDGRSFYFVAPNPDGPAREIHVMLNWQEELKQRVPTR